MKLFDLLNTTRCGNLFNSEMNTWYKRLAYSTNVKMSLTRRQSAWVQNPSETKRSAFSSGRILTNSTNFKNWLVGVTDGDGTFYFAQTKNGSWTFGFLISQSTYNLKMLHYIKSQLKVGQIQVEKNCEMAKFRIRNQEHLLIKILPIFDEFPLLTSKQFDYDLFKKAILINNDSNLLRDEKNLRLISLLIQKKEGLPVGYKSRAWFDKTVSSLTKETASYVMSKAWIIGFTEVEGSFYIVKKDAKRMSHAFEITQKKEDKIVLKAISLILHANFQIKRTHVSVSMTNKKSLDYIVIYFQKTMKGVKSLEFSIWSRSFRKRKRGFDYLLQIQTKMRNLRSIRLDKNCEKVKK